MSINKSQGILIENTEAIALRLSAIPLSCCKQGLQQGK